MIVARKKTVSAKVPEVRLTVRLTPEGIEEAQQRLAELRQRIRTQARDELIALAEKVSARSAYTSEEEVMADVEEAREAIWRRKQAQAS